MSSKPSERNGSGSGVFLVAFLIGALLLVLISCAAFALTPTVTAALESKPTSSRQVFWAMVEIAKPTYTPTTLPTLTSTPVSTLSLTIASTEASSVRSRKLVNGTATSTTDAQSANQVNAAGKYILVSISQQHLYAYDNGQLIYSFIASTGSGNSTRVGTFSVLDKIPNAYGADWNFWMPNWMGLYWAGTLEDGIHALPLLANGDRLWADSLGTPVSYGCVVLGVDDALQLYNWADVGTPVEIRR